MNRDLSVDDVVRLTRDVPHLNLHAGQTGVVRSLWHAPATAYEVEFTGLDERTRAVLLREQVAPEGESDLPHATEDAYPAAGAW